MTAGSAQRLVNISGYMPGNEVVVLGSGDIGLIMARRMTFEGAKVKAVVELLPYSSGLKRNIVQCLNDYNIPLMLNHTISKIHGKDRLEGITVVEVDSDRNEIKGSERYIQCDSLLLSVGLLPENELSRKIGVELSKVTGGAIVDNTLESNISGVFACGNALHVHDLVDNVTLESYHAGKNAARYIKNLRKKRFFTEVDGINGIRYVVPQKINLDTIEDYVTFRFRVEDVYRDSYIAVYFDEDLIIRRKKKILTPGEMEELKIKKDIFDKYNSINKIIFKVERI